MESVRIEAGKKVFETIDNFFAKGIAFAVETTLSGRSYIEIIKAAKEKGYKIIILYVFVDSAEACILRIKNRVKAGGHNVPDEDVRRRYLRSKKNFFNIYNDMPDEWILYYNGLDSAELVAHRKYNSIEVINENLYNFFKRDL